MANVLTPEFRVSYPSVFKPRKNDLNGRDEYSLVALFPVGADLSKLKEAANKALVEKLGADKTKWPANIRTPFKDQSPTRIKDGQAVENAGEVAGAVKINLKSTQKPQVVDENVQDIISEHDFYGGCWARASVNAYYYDQKGNRGVAFGLQNVQKVGEGAPLAGKPKAQTEFAPISGADVAHGSANDLF